MANIIKKGKHSYLFGSRIVSTISKHFGAKNFQEFQELFNNASMDTFAAFLFYAHENFCFFSKTALEIESVDHAYFVIDEMGLEEAADLCMKGMEAISGSMITETKKKTQKTPNK